MNGAGAGAELELALSACEQYKSHYHNHTSISDPSNFTSQSRCVLSPQSTYISFVLSLS